MANGKPNTVDDRIHTRTWEVFALAFCESFAFVSLLVPATGILLGVGGLITAPVFIFG
jgi:membrane protein DedA with SNARE-associated domain